MPNEEGYGENHDYIIIGGGTAGCILADRLTENEKYRVLMVEAGQTARSPWISIPAGFSKLLTDYRFNWRFYTEPEKNVYDRIISVPRGKGLGGSTLINGMIYVRGQAEDYDSWESLGARGWGFRDVEPYFRKLESFPEGGSDRGKSGPMYLARVAERFPISRAFLSAAVEDGQPLNSDYNSSKQEGFGYYQVLQHRGSRWSVVDGYLKKARHRRCLHIETNALVTRLLFDGVRCIGIAYRKDGKEIVARCNKEVLLCAGAVQSPQILELSGIGNPEVIKKFGIPVLLNNKEVGENYIEHFATRMNWRVKNTHTLNEMSRGWRLSSEVLKYCISRKGILTLGTGLVHGFVRTTPAELTADAQYFFVHASYANAADRILDRAPGMTIGVAQLRPESVGSIHIKSREPDAAPAIRPNFLDAKSDRHCLVAAMQIARRIVEQPAMQCYIDHEITPGRDVQSYDDWLNFAREDGQSIYHPVGTCRMGSDEKAVVDPRLRVRGVDGLRVIDASIMPKIVSGNTQAAVMMIAEKGADLVLRDDELG